MQTILSILLFHFLFSKATSKSTLIFLGKVAQGASSNSRMMVTNEINYSESGATREEKKIVISAGSHSPFENIEKQEDSVDEAPGPESIVCEDESSSWGVFISEAFLYIPMLMQSFLAILHRSIFWEKAVMLLFDKRSSLWLRRCHALLLKPGVWPPPSFQLLVALTLIALVVHPDGFTWVLLGNLRYVVVELDCLFEEVGICWVTLFGRSARDVH
jgi:hypothetical protein